MRVGLLGASISSRGGGVADAIAKLGEALARHCEVVIMGASDEYPAIPCSMKVVRGKVIGLKAFGYSPELRRLVQRANIDVLHSHGLWMYTSVIAANWTGPRIVSVHGMLDKWAIHNASWKKEIASVLYERRNLDRARCLHALNDAEAVAIRHYGLRNPVCVIPNGVHVPDIRAKGNANEKCCLFLGRIHPKKGLPQLLKEWARLRPERWKLKIVGWDQGDHLREVRMLASALGILDRVEFEGPVFGSRKREVFLGADAFVLPSFSEGLPVAVLEAWSYGLPVAMTAECNLCEGFELGAAVRLESDMSGLQQLLDLGDEKLRLMGERGRRLVEKEYTWTRVATEMARVYRWICGDGRQPECVRLES